MFIFTCDQQEQLMVEQKYKINAVVFFSLKLTLALIF